MKLTINHKPAEKVLNEWTKFIADELKGVYKKLNQIEKRIEKLEFKK